MKIPKPVPVSTGIEGLDNILGGGFTPNRIYLIEGDPGAGKTTLALQFLLEGRRRGEKGLYVSLSETKEELAGVAASHGWSLDGIHSYELLPSDESLHPDAQSRLFHPSDVELGDTTRAILSEVERIQPARVVFDSLSEMRLLAQHPLRYRRQVLALKQFFIGRQCTVLLLDDRTAADNDLQLHSLAHGVITLQHLAQEYGAERRRMRVLKMRGNPFRGGYHDFIIRTGGIEVFPRLVAAEHHRRFAAEPLQSGVAALDLAEDGSRGIPELHIRRMEQARLRVGMQAVVGGQQLVGVDALQIPAVGTGDPLELFLRLRERDIQALLPQPASLEKELQRERGLARPGIAFDEVDTVRREAAAEDVVESRDARCYGGLAGRLRHSYMKPFFMPRDFINRNKAECRARCENRVANR